MAGLFGLYASEYYPWENNSQWVSVAKEVIFGCSINIFDLEKLRFEFAWPDRLPYIDQIFFAVSISMACLDFFVQNLLPRKRGEKQARVHDVTAAAARDRYAAAEIAPATDGTASPPIVQSVPVTPAAPWRKLRTVDGRPYFYNDATGEMRWNSDDPLDASFGGLGAA